MNKCQWFLRCPNEATHTRQHPVLGDVPICDRCDALIRDMDRRTREEVRHEGTHQADRDDVDRGRRDSGSSGSAVLAHHDPRASLGVEWDEPRLRRVKLARAAAVRPYPKAEEPQ